QDDVVALPAVNPFGHTVLLARNPFANGGPVIRDQNDQEAGEDGTGVAVLPALKPSGAENPRDDGIVGLPTENPFTRGGGGGVAVSGRDDSESDLGVARDPALAPPRPVPSDTNGGVESGLRDEDEDGK
ncbi:hypothetical protein FRC06_011217, partial [Ceratobasidium sp. 370]